MVKAVIFDCFRVLYLERRPGSVPSLTESSSRSLRDLEGASNYGLIDNQTLYKSVDQLADQGTAEMVRSRGKLFVRNEALLDYGQSLRGTCKVAMLTNIGPDTIQLMFSAGERTRLFDGFFVSSEIGMIKPHPEVFEYACAQLGVDTSEAVVVDDVEANCTGAREAGLRTVLFRSTEQAIRDLNALLLE